MIMKIILEDGSRYYVANGVVCQTPEAAREIIAR